MTNTGSRTASHLRRAASGALAAAPVLAAAAITPPAAAAAAGPAAVPSCHPPAHRQAAAGPDGRTDGRRGRAEALIGNLHPAPGATVPAAATISFLIADSQPFPAPATRDVTVTVNGAPVTATAGTPETGIPVTYASHPGGRPRPASCEIPFTLTLPAAITGTAHIQAIARDSDGGTDSARWMLTIQATTLPTGAVGAITVTAAAGLALLATQARRRRATPPAHH